MKKLMIMLMALAVSFAAVAGENCGSDSEDCLAKMKTKYAEKAWLGVEYDKTDHGQLVVKKVYLDSPAHEAGFQKGDILLTMEGEEYSKANKTAIKKIYSGIKPGSAVDYVVKRQGAKVELDATLAHVPKEVQKKWIAEHMEKYHSEKQVASNN